MITLLLIIAGGALLSGFCALLVSGICHLVFNGYHGSDDEFDDSPLDIPWGGSEDASSDDSPSDC